MKACPCHECICLAICRHKYYFNLVNQCFDLNAFIYQFPHRDKRHELESIMKPTRWMVDETEGGTVYIDEKSSDSM